MGEKVTTKWNDEFLKSMSLKTDPLGESVVAEIITNNTKLPLAL